MESKIHDVQGNEHSSRDSDSHDEKTDYKIDYNKFFISVEIFAAANVQAEEKPICCSDSTVSVIEQSESLKTSNEQWADICTEFVTKNSETVLEQNSAIELDCSVAVTEGLQVEVKNVMDDLVKDIDCSEKNENVEFEKKNAQEQQKQFMNPNFQLQPSIDEVDTQDDKDGISSLWRQMFLSLGCSKDNLHNALGEEGKHEPECDHSFIHKDDLGYVCKLCGLIGQSAESIFDFQWWKGHKRTKQLKHNPSEHTSTYSEGNFIEVKECKER